MLVLGQVMPQIITARRPAAMMNQLPMAAAFHFTRGIGVLGLALPASWLVAWANKTERIPTAPRERFLANAHDVDGHGVDAISRTVHVTATGTTSQTITAVSFHDDDHRNIDVSLGSSSVAPTSLKVGARVLQRDVPILVSEISDRKYRGLEGATYGSMISPRVGYFQAGDTLSIDSTFTIDGWLGEDLLTIDAPTKLALLRVILDHPPAPLACVELEAVDPATGAARQLEQLPVIAHEDGSVELTAAIAYPEQGCLLRLRWAPTLLGTSRFQLQGVAQ